jgi:hypothetical protein
MWSRRLILATMVAAAAVTMARYAPATSGSDAQSQLVVLSSVR